MSKIKAVFFDRDDTLTYGNQDIYNVFYNIVETASKKKFRMNREKMSKLFSRVREKGFNTDTYENEVLFYKQYYREILIEECGYCDEDVAERMFDTMWLKDRVLFDDVLVTFKDIKSRGLKIGIISNTNLSLQKTLEEVGLGEYIDTYTSSKEVGIGKPETKIYLIAIEKLGLKPEECIYIDDRGEWVQSALDLGFKAFRINRENKDIEHFDIKSLDEIIKYLNKVR